MELPSTYDIDLWFYVKTPGCYVVADEFNNFVVCHRCRKEDPNTIDLTGDDLFIRYLTGDISFMIDYAVGVENIIFSRDPNSEDYKVYNYARLRRLVIAQR